MSIGYTRTNSNQRFLLNITAPSSAHFKEIIGDIVRISIEKVDSYLRRNDNRENQSFVEYFRTFRIIFRIFSNIFERFRTFSSVFALPILPNYYNLTPSPLTPNS